MTAIPSSKTRAARFAFAVHFTHLSKRRACSQATFKATGSGVIFIVFVVVVVVVFFAP